MPLHRFTSPNGNGLCTFESVGAVCGKEKTAIEHITRTEAPGLFGAPGNFITSHPYTPPKPGSVADPADGCGFALQDGGTCGAQPASHTFGVGSVQPHPGPLVPGRGMATPPDPVRTYLDEKASAAHETYHGATFPVDSPPTTAQVVAMFHDAALRLAVSKDQAYRKAWERQGYMGNVGRILSKVERLRNMVWGDRAVETMTTEELLAEESLRDTLLDLANLCAFAAHNMAEGNRWGGDRD